MKLIESFKKSFIWKIMASLVFVFLLISFSLAIVKRIDDYALNVIGKSYESNSKLNEFQEDLAHMENDMENYVAYKTFESVNSFYVFAKRVEDFCAEMPSFPSTDKILRKEYTVNQLSQSFLFFSSKAVAARRANNLQNEFYLQSLKCYNFLEAEISELNVLYLQKNAGVFDEDRKNVNLIFKIYYAFFVLFFAFVLISLGFFLRHLLKPLAEISQVALRVAERNFDVPLFNKNSRDEIGNICRAFDRMIISIREYIGTIWEKARIENSLREREMKMQALYASAQLKAFQSQINPHFLFNTLNTGAQLAMMEGADKTCAFIERTSDFFRYNIQQKHEATIREELGLVDNFVYIMQVRFGNRLEFSKDVCTENLERKLPVMILQPLVENCIKHGLQNARGKVFLRAENKNGFVEISVGDNGVPFAEEIRERILNSVEKNDSEKIPSAKNSQAKNDHAGIGLINVFSRMRIYFHSDEVFEIRDGKIDGIKFIIRVPENV
jgi:sensor histidine kinase YesM